MFFFLCLSICLFVYFHSSLIKFPSALRFDTFIAKWHTHTHAHAYTRTHIAGMHATISAKEENVSILCVCVCEIHPQKLINTWQIFLVIQLGQNARFLTQDVVFLWYGVSFRNCLNVCVNVWRSRNYLNVCITCTALISSNLPFWNF